MKLATVALAAIVLVSTAVNPVIAFSEPAKADQQSSHKEARTPRQKPSIINNSSEGPTIHFSACRENDKEHVSCQFKDEDGNLHWVYLAGIKLPGKR